MSRAPGVMAAWGLLLAALAAVQFAFRIDRLSLALAFGGALFVVTLAAVALLASRGGEGEGRGDEVRVVPDLSLATALGAVGLCTVAVGAAVGLWLALIGVGMVLFAAGGLIGERTSRRSSGGDR